MNILSKIEAELDDIIGWCENFLRNEARRMNDEFETVEKMPLEELPLHINDGDLTADLCIARLAGREIDTWEFWKQALESNEFDMDSFKDYGKNDGKLLVCARMYEQLGKKDKAQHATDLLYLE